MDESTTYVARAGVPVAVGRPVLLATDMSRAVPGPSAGTWYAGIVVGIDGDEATVTYSNGYTTAIPTDKLVTIKPSDEHMEPAVWAEIPSPAQVWQMTTPRAVADATNELAVQLLYGTKPPEGAGAGADVQTAGIVHALNVIAATCPAKFAAAVELARQVTAWEF